MPRQLRSTILLTAFLAALFPEIVGLPVGQAAPDDKGTEPARSSSTETRVTFTVSSLDGTSLEPVLLECRGELVIVQPEGVQISKDELASPIKTDNALVAALRSSLKSRAHPESEQSAAFDRFYPLLLVRPDGISTYYQAREALQAGQQKLGFELIEQDWKLETAENPADESSQPTASKPTTIRVEHVARPDVRGYQHDQLHIQLKGNRVATVPMAEFVKLFVEDAKLRVGRLREVAEVKHTLGPVDGFSMKYYLKWSDAPNGRSQLSYGFVLKPQSETLGENIAQALEPTSEFRRALQSALPDRESVKLWTYPDGFAAARIIRKELDQLGYGVELRPLPAGQPIGASTDGSASSP